MQTAVQDATPAFGVESKYVGGVAALRAAGRLVAGVGVGHPAWQAAREMRHAARLVVDLHEVTAIDAGGVGELLRLRQAAGRLGMPVVVEAAGPRVQRVLQLLHLDDVFGLRTALVPGTEHRSVPGTKFAALCRCA